MAENVLAKMAVEIAGNTASFSKSMQTAQGQLKDFSAGVVKAGTIIAGVFAAKKVAEFAFELAKLSGEADGVKKAFDKLPDSIALMQQLKDATSGTVSELDLMKRTVQATNFGISLESLPKLLEFAAVRAQQTGQSVDYLVDSIVTGIGRKSPLILDNLGISAVALKEKMGGVALATADIGTVANAVGKIAEDELKKMGSLSETTVTKTQRMSASWEDFKVTLGRVVNETGIVSGAIDALTGLMTNLMGVVDSIKNPDQANLIAFQKGLARAIKGESEPAIKSFLKELNALKSEIGEPINETIATSIAKSLELSNDQSEHFLKLIREINGEVTKKVDPIKLVDPVQIETLGTLQEKLKGLNTAFEQINITDQKGLTIRGQEIIAIAKQIEELEKLRKAREADLQMLTKYGRELLNQDGTRRGIGIDGTEAYTMPDVAPKPKDFNEMFPTEAAVKSADIIIQKLTEIDGVWAELDKNNEIRNARDVARWDALTEAGQRAAANAAQIGQTIGSAIGTAFGQSIAITQQYKDKVSELTNEIARTNASDVERINILKAQRAEYQEAINGNKALVTALKKATKEIVSTMLARALASAISTSFSSSGNPVIGAALAAGASAAVIGLFNAIPDWGSTSVGAASIGTRGTGATTAAERFQPQQSSQTIVLSGEFKASGRDLVLAINNQNRANQRGLG